MGICNVKYFVQKIQKIFEKMHYILDDKNQITKFCSQSFTTVTCIQAKKKKKIPINTSISILFLKYSTKSDLSI